MSSQLTGKFKSICTKKLLTIFLSSSQCIYENLAFEEWIFRNHNIRENGDALIIWRNTPSVVIGRYQNPWLETDAAFCVENDIKIARRNSGGGAVYHDLGNINVSILTTHEMHSRKKNLQYLATQLNANFPLLPSSQIVVNHRDDLVMEPEGSKISGTAARISRGKAYHHFTLLVDANMEKLRRSLHSPLKGKIETSATNSIPAKSVSCIIQKMAIGYPSLDGLMEIVCANIMKSFSSQYLENKTIELDPSFKDAELTGLSEIVDSLKDEEWIFGRTPKFVVEIPNKRNPCTIRVEKGKIEESTCAEFPTGVSFHQAFLLSDYSKILHQNTFH